MTRKRDGKGACFSGSAMCCSGVEALVTVDDRGQMVLPKEIRQRAGIRGGDKLAVVALERGGKICCLSLIKADELTRMVAGMLGPLAESEDCHDG